MANSSYFWQINEKSIVDIIMDGKKMVTDIYQCTRVKRIIQCQILLYMGKIMIKIIIVALVFIIRGGVNNGQWN